MRERERETKEGMETKDKDMKMRHLSHEVCSIHIYKLELESLLYNLKL